MPWIRCGRHGVLKPLVAHHFWQQSRTLSAKVKALIVRNVGAFRLRLLFSCDVTAPGDDLRVRRWDYLILTGEQEHGSTLYSEPIVIVTGLLMLSVGLLLQWLYHHRQYRW
jgi:hypothetical protein